MIQHKHRDKWIEQNSQKVCAIDIDGVLVKYPECFVAWVNKTTNSQFQNLTAAKNTLSYSKYKELKREYRNSGVKATLPPMEGATEFTKSLANAGYQIVIITARDPNWENRQVFRDTIIWLQKNKIAYDHLIWGKDKHFKIIQECPNLRFMIEDNRYLAQLIGKYGYRVYLLDNEYNQGELLPSVVRVKTLKQVLDCEGVQ